MILWTIQLHQSWEKMQQKGILRADPQYVWPEFISAYTWMAGQMQARLGFRPSENAFPLWAWYQWEGERRKRPDLRCSGHLPKGERGVRIEFEMKDSLVVLSDFELWHFVLNYWYLPATEADGEAFEAELEKQGLSFYQTKPLPHPTYHKRIVESWNRIFDVEWTDEYVTSRKEEKSIQATFWKLHIDQVKSVRAFTAR